MADPTSIQEMRQRITRASAGRERVDGRPVRGVMGPSSAAPIIRTARHLADREGLSGEDMMTMIAYQALVSYEAAMDRLLDDASLRTDPFVLFTEPDYATALLAELKGNDTMARKDMRDLPPAGATRRR